MLDGSNPLFTLAITIGAGVMFGGLAKRIHLPSVTGQILIGILIGPSVLGVFDTETIHGLQPVTHFALGLIAVTVGSHLNFHRLRNARRRLSLLLIAESTITPLTVLAVMMISQTEASLARMQLSRGEFWSMGVLIAAMAVSTAPATIIALIRECRAKGVFVKTLVAGVALNNIACICIFEVARAAARASLAQEGAGGSGWDVVTAPLIQLGASVLVGGLAGLILVRVTRRVVRRDRLATSSIIAIMFTSGLADFLQVSPLLSCMFLGIALANLTPEKDETGHQVFSDFESAIFAVFFTMAGMELDLAAVAPAGLLAVAVLFARMLGKFSSAWIAMKIAGATDAVRRNLGAALIPQAGVAVGLILVIQEDPAFPDPLKQMLLAVGLSVVTLNEIIGPLTARYAFKRSGDYGKDRARLIDFLHEENIVTDMQAQTKEEAIRELAELLIVSNGLKDDRERLMQSILDRERDVSTCVGGGLAVPHGVLEEGDGIVGVMGINREGWRFETPDGKPVHCMVVLATPPTQRDRHLEVLAALARAIGTDPNVQRELFNAKTSAHAYEILHAEESEDFNYFLEDEG